MCICVGYTRMSSNVFMSISHLFFLLSFLSFLSSPLLLFLPSFLPSFLLPSFLFQVVTDLIHGDAVTMRDDGHGQVVLSGATEEPVKDAADLQGQLERAYVVLNE